MELKEFEVKLKKDYAFTYNVAPTKINGKLLYAYVLKRLFKKEVESTYDMQDSDIYDLLNHIVKWYHKFGASASPDELLDCRDKIVTCNYWLSQKLSEYDTKYNLKVQHNKAEIDMLISQESSSVKITKARSNAKQSKRMELMQEANYKSEITRIERLLDSLNDIVNAMQQRIAWLRQEASKNPTF